MRLSPIPESEFEQQFQLIKRGIRFYVDEVWGWDDEFQRRRIHQNNPQTGFYWIDYQDNRAGLVCYRLEPTKMHVHFLIIDEQFQNLGIGREVMRMLETIAVGQHATTLTLSSFLANEGALRFYEALGYVVSEYEPPFANLEKKIRPSS
jgi:ribosomal protein S18 acetylase RimI-like enzyme